MATSLSQNQKGMQRLPEDGIDKAMDQGQGRKGEGGKHLGPLHPCPRTAGFLYGWSLLSSLLLTA